MSRLSAIDLLELTDEEQALVRCLSQRPALTLRELAQCAELSLEQTEQAVTSMLRASRIVEQLKDGQRVFSVRFSRKRKHIRNTPASILSLIDLPPAVFLGRALFSNALDDEQRAALLSRSERRMLMPGEVVVWQNSPLVFVGVVSIGLLKQSRLRGGQRVESVTGYVRRGEWFGVSEVLSNYQSADTYTALSETEVLLWPMADFLDFVARHAAMSMAISTWASRQLHQQLELPGQLWAIEGAHPGAGVSTIATNLAALAAREVGDEGGASSQVLLWKATGSPAAGQEPEPSGIPGVDLLGHLVDGDYPAQVQIDILLADLQRRYRYILLDSGAGSSHLLQGLRGRATTLLSVTTDPAGAAAINARWASLKTLARPGQRRLAVLNAARNLDQGLDAAFQLALPHDPEQLSARALLEIGSESPLSGAMHELYRRLSLMHTIGIFIPSTLDVATAIDNSQEVQEALKFLGSLFGGATKSESEGVWKSEEHGLVVEQVTIVRSFVSRKALEQCLDDVVGFVTRLKQVMRQEAMAVDVDNQLVLV